MHVTAENVETHLDLWFAEQMNKQSDCLEKRTSAESLRDVYTRLIVQFGGFSTRCSTIRRHRRLLCVWERHGEVTPSGYSHDPKLRISLIQLSPFSHG